MTITVRVPPADQLVVGGFLSLIHGMRRIEITDILPLDNDTMVTGKLDAQTFTGTISHGSETAEMTKVDSMPVDLSTAAECCI